MNTLFVKIIFLIFTLVIFIYSSSYAKFEITKKNNTIGGIIIFIFILSSIVFSNIIFFITWILKEFLYNHLLWLISIKKLKLLNIYKFNNLSSLHKTLFYTLTLFFVTSGAGGIRGLYESPSKTSTSTVLVNISV